MMLGKWKLRFVPFSDASTSTSELRKLSTQSMTDLNAPRENPVKLTTSPVDSINAAMVADVRRGACNKLSAARGPSMGRILMRAGRSSRQSHNPAVGASSSAADKKDA